MKFTCEYSKKNDQFYVTPSGIAWSISKIGLIFGEQPETIMSLGWVNVSKDIIEKLFRFFVVVPEKPKQIIDRLRANLPARSKSNRANYGKHKARSKRGSGRKPSQCKERGCRQ